MTWTISSLVLLYQQFSRYISSFVYQQVNQGSSLVMNDYTWPHPMETLVIISGPMNNYVKNIKHYSI